MPRRALKRATGCFSTGWEVLRDGVGEAAGLQFKPSQDLMYIYLSLRLLDTLLIAGPRRLCPRIVPMRPRAGGGAVRASPAAGAQPPPRGHRRRAARSPRGGWSWRRHFAER